MRTILKAFNEKDHLRNTIVSLTLQVERIVFVVRKPFEKSQFENISTVFAKHLRAQILFEEIDYQNEREQILEIFRKYPESEIDMSGSRYLLLLLFEEALQQKRNIWYYDEKKNQVRNYFNRQQSIAAVNLPLEDMLLLAGGKIVRQLHQQPNKADQETNRHLRSLIEKVMPRYSDFVSSISTFMRLFRSQEKRGDQFLLEKEVLAELAKDSFLQLCLQEEILFQQENRIRYRNAFVRSLFEVSGAWLEMYLYLLLVESKEFEEVRMSVNIDFASKHRQNFPVLCEIDVMAIRQNHLLFISCKSNKVDSMALNEIALHNLYFGNELSKALMATFEETHQRNPLVAAKAKELSICLLDRSVFRQQAVVSTILPYVERR